MSAANANTPPRRPAKRVQSNLNPDAPGPSTQVYKPRDPAIERALQLSTFEGNYSTEEFVGSLSEKLIKESEANPGALDPNPFLQTFSPALDSLLALRQQVAERTKKMEGDVRRAEREYGKRLRELDGGFEAIGSSFSNLETKITDVSRSAVRIGEQLESLHQTRSTAQSTSLLLSYYLSLVHQTSKTPDPNNPASNPLETLFSTRTSREGRSRLSVILRRLMAVAKDMADNASTALAEAEAPEGEDKTVNNKLVVRRRSEKEKAERVRDEVERYCERFEKEVLRLFDRSYRKGDPRMMAHCARTLQDFNGGASCVQIYVNQHDFFISKDRVIEEAERQNAMEGEDENGAKRVDIWATIGSPDEPPPTSEPGMAALLKEVRITVSQEAQIVRAVFPNPGAVMQVFLQRVFAQVLQQHLETLVSRAHAISTLAVLRILNMTHAMCSALLEDLKSYESILGSTTAGSPKTGSASGSIGAMTEAAMDEIFVPWIEGTRYLESESKNLVELYAGLLSRFTRYHETVLKAKPNSLLDKVVFQLASSSSAATSSSTAQAAAAAISKYANVFTSSSLAPKLASPNVNQNPMSPTVASKSGLPHHIAMLNGTSTPLNRSGTLTPMNGRPGLQRVDSMRGDLVNKGLEEKPWPSDGVLTVEMAERMLKWHAEAVGRVVELSGTSDVAKNAFALSKVLAEAIGRSLIETALDSSTARLEGVDNKNEPDLSPLSALRPSDLICHIWQRYASTALLPLAGSNTTTRREMITTNSHNVVRMEGKISTLIQKAIDNIIAYLAFLLTKQKRNDYKPKDDELSFARTNTEPCTLSSEFLETVRDVVRENLSGKNAEAFMTEVGVSFHRDLASYQDVVSSFAIPALSERFDMLRQLGNLFIVQPNVLKSYMTESYLGRIDTRLLRPYLQQRSDWSTFSRTLVLDDGLPVEAADPVSHSATPTAASGSLTPGGPGGRFKGSRLSVMSGVAGAGMGKLKEMLKEFDALSPEEAALAAKNRERFAANAHLNRQPVYMPLM